MPDPDTSAWKPVDEDTSAWKPVNEGLPPDTRNLIQKIRDFPGEGALRAYAGAKDFIQHPSMHATHEILAGAGQAAVPFAAPAIAAYGAIPVAVGAGGALLGGAAGKTGASMLGADEDTSDVAGDIGGLIGGGVGSRVPGLAGKAVSGLRAVAGNSTVRDAVGIVSPRLSHGLSLLERGGRVVDALRGTEPKQTPLAKTLSFDPGEKINPDRIPSPITTSKGPSLPVRNGATISTGGTNAPPAGGLHSGLVLPAIRKGLREFGNDIVGPPTPPDSSQPVTPPSSTAIAHPQATITSPLRTGPRIEINAPRPEAQPNTGPQATPKLKPSQDAEYRGMLLQRRFKTDPGDASLYPGSKRGVPMEASFQSNARGQTAPVSVRSIPASQVGKFAASQGWTPEEAITHLKLAGFLIPQK